MKFLGPRIENISAILNEAVRYRRTKLPHMILLLIYNAGESSENKILFFSCSNMTGRFADMSLGTVSPGPLTVALESTINCSIFLSTSFTTQWRGRRRERQTGFISKTTTLQVHHAFLYLIVFASFCTTTTWKCRISRFVEDVNKQRRNLISLSVLGYGP